MFKRNNPDTSCNTHFSYNHFFSSCKWKASFSCLAICTRVTVWLWHKRRRYGGVQKIWTLYAVSLILSHFCNHLNVTWIQMKHRSVLIFTQAVYNIVYVRSISVFVWYAQDRSCSPLILHISTLENVKKNLK